MGNRAFSKLAAKIMIALFLLFSPFVYLGEKAESGSRDSSLSIETFYLGALEDLESSMYDKNIETEDYLIEETIVGVGNEDFVSLTPARSFYNYTDWTNSPMNTADGQIVGIVQTKGLFESETPISDGIPEGTYPLKIRYINGQFYSSLVTDDGEYDMESIEREKFYEDQSPFEIIKGSATIVVCPPGCGCQIVILVK